MDRDEGKVFVGGISWETTEERLKEYFGKYGDVYQVNIMKDKVSGRPRGFGFVVFSDPNVIDSVLQDKHSIDGRPVEAKRAMSREEQQNTSRTGYANGGSNVENVRTKKIFVGGLPPTLSDEGFRQYFENYGHVADVVIMYDPNTQRPRGFGFISFDSEDAVDRVLQKTFHDIDGKQVEVKRALPKDSNPGMANRRSGGYGSGNNQSSYDSRIDSNRYMQQPQNSGGAFPPYGSSGYGATGYGYGGANSGMAYGGYGGHGNPNVPSAGYGANGQTSAMRNSWNGQPASGYGAAAAWGAGGGPTGQAPSAAFGYGNQGYGYGSYGGGGGGGDGTYGRTASGGGGAGGGDMQGNNSGYGDANGHGGYGGGYGGAPMGYGGGYSGAQNRQPQQ